ncbi:MAG: CCA tRNA nucleotidyltransferase [Pseudomonadota bacterium]
MANLEAPWLTSAGSLAVFAMLEGAGHQAWFVGGCVRNALMEEPVSDLDIATDALPEDVMKLAEGAGLKAVPTGIAHGTVTVVSAAQTFEITTFRRDVETDGRRAVVAFSEQMEDDARRRDFTVNALYAGKSGEVRDPVGGLADLEDRRFRFIGDPHHRICEDYLRILRFFRFFAWYGRDLDADGLAACSSLSEGVLSLSAERVTSEMLKLLAARDPARAVAAMEHAGILQRVLPGGSSRFLAPFLHLDPVAEIDPIARLAAIGGDVSGLRLSRADAKALDAYRHGLENTWSAGRLGYALGEDQALRVLALRAALFEHPLDPAHLEAARKGAASVLPVRAADLPDTLVGPEIGNALKILEDRWIDSDFGPSKAELLASL